MEKHVARLGEYIVVYVVLLLLLAATIACDKVDLGRWNTIAAFTIATVKAVIVILYFMHVRYSSGLTKVFALAGFFWLAILIGLSLCDFLTRGTGLG